MSTHRHLVVDLKPGDLLEILDYSGRIDVRMALACDLRKDGLVYVTWYQLIDHVLSHPEISYGSYVWNTSYQVRENFNAELARAG